MTKRNVQMVRVRSTVASGPIDVEAVVTRYDPPPFPEAHPIIWVRPKGWQHDLSVTSEEVEPLTSAGKDSHARDA